LVVILDAVFTDLALVGLAMMLGRGRVRKVPFDEGCAGNVWDVVQVNNLEVEIKFRLQTSVSQCP
jgi:hypothetical protein